MSPENPRDDATAPLPQGSPPPPRSPDVAAAPPGPSGGAEGASAAPVAAGTADSITAAGERGPRTGTLVGALVLILLGAGVVAVGVGARLDLQAALIALLVIAGLGLLVGALLNASRSR